jgi:hypothetical protein
MADRSLYETDIVAWSEQQAEALRAQARRAGDNAVDWENLIDEMETVGRSEIRAATAGLRQVLIHLIKAASWPDPPDFAHWRTEVRAFLADLRDDYTPSMRQRIDVDKIWRDAMAIAEDSLAEQNQSVAKTLPAACPFSADTMASGVFDFDFALRQLHATLRGTI